MSSCPTTALTYCQSSSKHSRGSSLFSFPLCVAIRNARCLVSPSCRSAADGSKINFFLPCQNHVVEEKKVQRQVDNQASQGPWGTGAIIHLSRHLFFCDMISPTFIRLRLRRGGKRKISFTKEAMIFQKTRPDARSI